MTTMTDNNLVVADELEDIAMLLAGQGQLANDIDLAASKQFASVVKEEFQRLELATEMLEYDDLNPILAWVMENIDHAQNTPDSLVSLQNNGHFFQWVELLAASLRQNDTLLLPELTSCLTHPDWPVELPEKTLQTFLLTLATPKPQSSQTVNSDNQNIESASTN